LTNGKYFQFNIVNIYGLKHKDLFLATFYYLISHPDIFHSLKDYRFSIIGISFTNLETNKYKIYNIHPEIVMNKYTSFQEFYLSIILNYNFIGPMENLDDIYKLEVKVMKF
jgi:hypothetical protein